MSEPFGYADKRILSMISRQGGKSRLFKTLIPLFPVDSRFYCEAFGGAAWVLLNKDPHAIEVYNDVEGNIVNLFRVVRDFPGEFVNRLRYDILARDTFDRYKKLEYSTLEPIDRAVKWYYVYYNSFNADMNSMLVKKVKTNPNRWGTSMKQRVEHFAERFADVVVENLDFRTLLKKYNSSDFFYYVDPPYYETAGYEVPFVEKDHQDLAAILSQQPGKWMVSYNAHPVILDLYKDFNVFETTVDYQCANRPNAYKDKPNKAAEVIITNYDLPSASSNNLLP